MPGTRRIQEKSRVRFPSNAGKPRRCRVSAHATTNAETRTGHRSAWTRPQVAAKHRHRLIQWLAFFLTIIELNQDSRVQRRASRLRARRFTQLGSPLAPP
jgi:hypothetical protein